MKMKFNAPGRVAWIISLILGLLSLLSYFTVIPLITAHLFWFMAAAWLVLLLATILKGL